ncbi:MAG: DUF5056 domain-containing protein [Betaproteobacteria bacterium]|nr:DUF5056 domain-containing protein [Betaproteobacteria bacterium]
MNTDPSRDDLESRLLAQLRREIADDGFTARVAHALPRARRRIDWTFPLVTAAALVGCVFATFLVPVGPAILEGLRDLAAARAFTPAAIGALAAMGALAATGAVMAADS